MSNDKRVVTKKVVVKLVGIDGNAFMILGAFKSAARSQGCPPEEIKKVVELAMGGTTTTFYRSLWPTAK